MISFDVDLMADSVGGVQVLTLPPSDEGGYSIPGRLSPNGAVVSVYVNAISTDSGTTYGELSLTDLTTGQEVPTEIPGMVGVFRWQP